MTPAEVLYGQQVPEPVYCLGLRLRPYCLGHHLILRRFNLVTENPDGDSHSVIDEIRDLLLGCFVCSQTYEEAGRALQSPRLPLFMWFWRWRIRNLDFQMQRAIFAHYIEAGTWQPDENLPKDQRTKWMGSPWETRLKCTLMRELGYREVEVMNCPLALCRLDVATIAEMDGRIELFNASDEALFAMARKMDLEELEKPKERNGK